MQTPEGLTSRPLAHGDARAVFEVIAAQELEDIGMIEIEAADIVGDWGRPSFDVAASTIGVLDGDTMVGYGEVSYPDRGDAAVLPAYRGRGIGTALALWMQETARHQGATVVGMPVPEGSPGDRLLDSLGYQVRWTSWVLRLPEDATIVERSLPEGYAVREANPAEYTTVHDVKEDAFLEWSVRERQPYDDFYAVVIGRPGFEPWQSTRLQGHHKGKTVKTFSTPLPSQHHQRADGSVCTHHLVSDDGAVYPADRAGGAGTQVKTGPVITPTALRRQHSDTGYQLELEYLIACPHGDITYPAPLSDTKPNSDGRVAWSSTLAAHRVIPGAWEERFQSAFGARNQSESFFSWLERRYYQKDRVASWGRDAQLVDLLCAAILHNTEAWAHYAYRHGATERGRN